MTNRSRRSRSAPGNVQGRGKGNASRFVDALRTKRIDDEKRAQIHELGDARRASVYRTDVEFAPSDVPTPLPVKGSPERVELLTDVVFLRREGLSHMKIAHALYPKWPMWSASTVAVLLKEAGEK